MGRSARPGIDRFMAIRDNCVIFHVLSSLNAETAFSDFKSQMQFCGAF